MASLKTAQQCSHPWAWHVEGACQKCRIEMLEGIVRDIEPDYAAYTNALRCNLCGKWTPTEGSPRDFDGVPLHKAGCLYVRAQEALKGELQMDTEDAKRITPMSTGTR